MNGWHLPPPRTRLGLLCEHLIEAGWLAALVAVPLYFNIFSTRIFEGDKAILLRTLATLMAGAWIIRLLEGRSLAQNTSPPAGPPAAGKERPPRAAEDLSLHPARADRHSAASRATAPLDSLAHRQGRPQIPNTRHGFGDLSTVPDSRDRQESVALRPAPTGPRGWLGSLLAPVGALFLAQLASAVCSIQPRFSWWGSYDRMQGLYTFASYGLIFCSMATLARTRAQFERIVTTLLITAVPVALYGILQRLDLDPFPWEKPSSARVLSSLGNPIFLGAWLILIIPLAAWRLGQSLRQVILNESTGLRWALPCAALLNLALGAGAWHRNLRTASLAALVTLVLWCAQARLLGRDLRSFLRVGLHLVLLALLLAALFFTGSRGPLAGLLAACGLALLLASLVLRRYGLALMLGAAAVLLAAGLCWINHPSFPWEELRQHPALVRWGELLEKTGKVRLLIWSSAFEAATADPLRALVGHGPETIKLALFPFYPIQLRELEVQGVVPDRSHNEILDLWIQSGLLGVSAQLWLWAAILYATTRWLGLRPPGPSRARLLLLLAGGTALAAGACLAFDPLQPGRLLGAALPLGLLGGWLCHLLLLSLGKAARRRTCHLRPAATLRRVALIALLALLAGHLVETDIGISVTPTRLTFWTALALLWLIGSRRIRLPAWTGGAAPSATPSPAAPQEQAPAQTLRASLALPLRSATGVPQALLGPGSTPSGTQSAGSWPTLLEDTTLVGMILLTLGAVFLQAGGPPRDLGSTGAVWFFGAAWSLAALLVACERLNGPDPGRQDAFRAMNRQSVSLGLTWAAAFLLLGLALPLGLSRILAAPLAASGLPAPPYLLVLVLAAGGLGLLWTVWPSPAWAPPAWQPQTAKPVRVATRGQGWAIVPLLAGLGFLIEQANLRPLRADLLHREGELQAQFLNRVERAEQAFRQALELAPTQDHYHPALGELWLRQLAASKPGARAEALAAETRRLFEEACRLSPLDPDHPVNLGRFYQVWSEHAEGRAEQVRRLDLAAEQYGRALRLFPYAVWWWGEWAWIEHLRGEPARADRNLAHALALDETCLATWLVKGRLLLARHDSAGAISTLSQALRLSPSNIPAHFLLSLAYRQGGRADLAGASQQRAAQATGGQPQGILTLATWYARYGMREEALRLIRGGPKDAPPRIQAQLRSLQEELER